MQNMLYTDNVLRPTLLSALECWARMVRANREQAERFREKPEKSDFYAPTSSNFKADPRRTGDTVLDILKSLVVPGETWLDIGSGSGRYTLPLALVAGEITAVEPSASMRSVLLQGMEENGIKNINIVEKRWPIDPPPVADVALISHVGYDVEAIGPFLNAMEKAVRRLCIAIFTDGAPSSAAEKFWPAVHGEKRYPLPALREFLVLQIARGRLCEVKLLPQQSPGYPDRDRLLAYLRQQLFIEPGGIKDILLQKLVDQEAAGTDGRFYLTFPSTLGIVTWRSV